MSSSTLALIARALKVTPQPPPGHTSINLALSGGVDSSVAGFLLRERGWSITPILMRCWDDDAPDANLPSCHEADIRASRVAVEALKLTNSLRIFDFVSEYWTEVFDGEYLAGLRAGRTPNPDLICNARVKFGAFPRRLREIAGTEETPLFATGHYSRLRNSAEGLPHLLRAADAYKDQTYFLASVPASALKSAVFPLGELLKSEVREIARAAKLPAASARSSRGLCFVGKRKMAPFLERYIPKCAAGSFLDASSGRVVAQLPQGAYTYTIGQRARIGGAPEALYVVGREGEDVLVDGANSEKLIVHEVQCRSVDWVRGMPEAVRDGTWLEAKECSTATRKRCWVRQEGGGVLVRFKMGVRRVADGQAIVLYKGDECLGAAWAGASGRNE